VDSDSAHWEQQFKRIKSKCNCNVRGDWELTKGAKVARLTVHLDLALWWHAILIGRLERYFCHASRLLQAVLDNMLMLWDRSNGIHRQSFQTSVSYRPPGSDQFLTVLARARGKFLSLIGSHDSGQESVVLILQHWHGSWECKGSESSEWLVLVGC